MTIKKTINAIDLYIADFPAATQKLLQRVRDTIYKAAPHAEEKIGYGIPTFVLHGNLVHFAGYKYHIGFYPGAAGIATFSKELSAYKQSKGAVQFPLDKPVPLTLITKITKFRVQQNTEKEKRKVCVLIRKDICITKQVTALPAPFVRHNVNPNPVLWPSFLLQREEHWKVKRSRH